MSLPRLLRNELKNRTKLLLPLHGSEPFLDTQLERGGVGEGRPGVVPAVP